MRRHADAAVFSGAHCLEHPFFPESLPMGVSHTRTGSSSKKAQSAQHKVLHPTSEEDCIRALLALGGGEIGLGTQCLANMPYAISQLKTHYI